MENTNKKVDNGSEEIFIRVARRSLNNPEQLEIRLPNEFNSCVKCPNAMWFYEDFKDNKEKDCIKAFCRITHEIKFNSSIIKNITLCAGVRIS